MCESFSYPDRFDGCESASGVAPAIERKPLCHNSFIDLQGIDVASTNMPAILVDGYDIAFHGPPANDFLETNLGPRTIAFAQLFGIDTPEADVLIAPELQGVTIDSDRRAA